MPQPSPPTELKALFLDMDETLCDTTGANRKALQDMAQLASQLLGKHFDALAFANGYLQGIYRNLPTDYQRDLLPLAEQSELHFRHALIQRLITDAGIALNAEQSLAFAQQLQDCFDSARTKYFDFFPGILTWLTRMREQLKLVVITNGPEFSQVTKIERVNMATHVDHVLIGGLEPAEKPHKSIFDKALRLANCQPEQVIHIGDSLATDILGARNSNIASVWVQHEQQPDRSIQANWTVAHPSDIPSLIDDLLTHT
ncbi:MAG: HAD family hydrolase [Pseudomonadales bacterium]|nr:HAD family hydrolase [Pseudomonadales bacterium]